MWQYKKKTGDSVLWIETLNNGSSSDLLLRTTASMGKLSLKSAGLLQFTQSNQTTNFSHVVGLEVYPNGVLSSGSKQNNKLFVLQENGSSSDPVTSTNFYGFGYNTGVIRYQTPSLGNIHRFLCGSTSALSLSDTSASFSGTIS